MGAKVQYWSTTVAAPAAGNIQLYLRSCVVGVAEVERWVSASVLARNEAGSLV